MKYTADSLVKNFPRVWRSRLLLVCHVTGQDETTLVLVSVCLDEHVHGVNTKLIHQNNWVVPTSSVTHLGIWLQFHQLSFKQQHTFQQTCWVSPLWQYIYIYIYIYIHLFIYLTRIKGFSEIIVGEIVVKSPNEWHLTRSLCWTHVPDLEQIQRLRPQTNRLMASFWIRGLVQYMCFCLFVFWCFIVQKSTTICCLGSCATYYWERNGCWRSQCSSCPRRNGAS